MQNPFKEVVGHGKAPPTAAGMLSPHEMEGPGKMFLKAGKSLYDRIVMTIFRKREVVSAVAEYVSQCKEFPPMDKDDSDAMQWLDIHLVGWRAVYGAALAFALQGSTSIISETTTAGVLELPIAKDMAKRPDEQKKKDEEKQKQQGGK